MSRNTSLSELINYVSASNNGNVTVAPPASGFALEVFGTGRYSGALSGSSAAFTSTVTASAFIPTGLAVPTNGMYLPSANTLAFATSGSVDMTLTSAGNVLINKVNDEGFRLDVAGTGRFSGALSGSSATFTSNIVANSTDGISGAFRSNTFFGSIDLENTGGAATGKWNIQAVSGAQVGGTAGSSFGIYSYGASLYRMFINSSGNVGIGTITPENITTYRTLQIVGGGASTGGIFTTSTSDGSLKGRFLTSGGEISIGAVTNSPFIMFTNDTERMRILSGGNVGIGTTNPGSKLQVEGGEIRATTSNAGVAIYASGGNGEVAAYNWAGSAYLNLNMVGLSHTFQTSGTERMRITSGGNVGIGITSPGARLDVLSTLNVQATGNSDVPYINFSNNGRSFDWGRVGGLLQGDGDGALYFSTKLGGGVTEKMRITSGGKLLLGTSTNGGYNFTIASGVSAAVSTVNGLAFRSNVTGTTGQTDLQGILWNDFIGNDLARILPVVDNTASSAATSIRFLNHSGSSIQERMRISSDGRVTIGDTSTNNSGKFEFASPGVGAFNGVVQLFHSTSNNTSSGYVNFFVNNTVIGSINQNGTNAIAYNTTSDYRLKEDLKPINGLEIVNKIKVYDYKWKAEDRRMDGVLAHELAEVLPYAVTGEKDGERMQGVDYSKIVPVLIQSIKELKSELDAANNRIQLLENK